MNTETYTGEGDVSQALRDFSRRDAMASICALSLAAIAVASDALRETQANPAGSIENPDQELSALGVALQKSWDAEKAYEQATKGDFSQETDRRIEALADISAAIVNRICVLPASTIAGVFVKVRAIQWCHGEEDFELGAFDDIYGTTKDIKIAASLTCDLLRMSEAENA